ncbi:Trm112 family protein [Desulfovibrio inopinatus]|uniref:Trm112 family protein n=1 Tax=Desulfovibrio inopinatus TaxID=102109 RepID=UPI0003F59F29|nr:Trm112 family protein [Desulfovibrio inopinatus]
MLDPKLLEILACPKCKGDLTPVTSETGLFCEDCNVVYPIREDIPIMLVDEAVAKPNWDRGERSSKSTSGSSS